MPGTRPEHFSHFVVLAAHVLNRGNAGSEVHGQFPIPVQVAPECILSVELDEFFDTLRRSGVHSMVDARE